MHASVKRSIRQRVIIALQNASHPEYMPVCQFSDGLCSIVQKAVDPDYRNDPMRKFALDLLHYTFKMLLPKCNSSNPLGDYFKDGNLWKGERGAARRKLASQCAEWLEANTP